MLLDLRSVFEAPDDPSSSARMAALDAINRKFGNGALVYVSAGLKRQWDMLRGYTSKAYSAN